MSAGISVFDPTLSLEKLKTMPESHYFDRKSGRLESRDLAHHVSAFANASGGTIALGLENNGDITGVSPEKENEFRKVFIDHLATAPEHEIETIPVASAAGKPCQIMLVHVKTSADEVICLKNGDAYLRVGDSSRKLTPEQFTSLEYSRGIKSYESRVVADATLDDLDPRLIREYVSLLAPSASSTEDILKARGLIKPSTNGWQITVAAILLFAKHPTQFLPSARVRFLRYEGISAGVGTRMNLIKDITLEKPLHQLLSEGQILLKAQMREFQRLGMDGKFVRIPEYPDFAWLEGLVNAVAHRDYSVSGDYIRITMFDDRIEFHSPGRLPSIVTVNNIQETRFSRNPIIARVLSDFGWVRELNEGVKRIYVDMNSFFLEPPQFSEPNKNTVLLVLKNNIAMRSLRNMEACAAKLQNVWSDISALDREIVYYIANMEKCTPSDLSQVIRKSRPTIKAHIEKLKSCGIVQEHSSSANDPTKYYTISDM